MTPFLPSVVSLIPVAVCLPLFFGCASSNRIEPWDGHVRQLVKEMAQDEGNSITVSPFHAFVYRRWEFLFHDAEARMLVMGRPMFDGLLALVSQSDDHLSRLERECAWRVLMELDALRTLPELLEARASGRISDEFTTMIVHATLPIDGARREKSEYPELLDWLALRVKEIGARAVYLELVDKSMALEDSNWATIYLALLNRCGDRDIDEWLRNNAPRAAAFREKMVQKGCDPFGRLAHIAGGEQSIGRLDKFSRVLFANEEERKAFLEFFAAHERLWKELELASIIKEIHYANGTLRYIQDWEPRVRAWYLTNRWAFVYEPARLRFVTKEVQAR